MRLLDAAHRTAIEERQPLNFANAHEHPLRVLQDLSNRDKHRLLHATVARISATGARFYGSGIYALHGTHHHLGAVEAGTELVIYEYEGNPEEGVHLEGTFGIDVGLERLDDGVRQTLDAIIDECAEIVELFGPVFDWAVAASAGCTDGPYRRKSVDNLVDLAGTRNRRSRRRHRTRRRAVGGFRSE